MPTPTVYVICDQNCKFEGMTKEQILTAITQAVNNGTIGNLDTGFITTIKTITGTPLKFFVGEQSEYEALTDDDRENLFAIITNDATKDGLLQALEDLQTDYTELREGLESGDIAVEKANSIDNTEIYFATVSTSGVEVAEIKRGRTYLITAIIDESDTSNVANTLLLSVPKATSINNIISTPTNDGNYANCVLNSPPDLWFNNSSGTNIAVKKVTIREI